MAERKDRPQYDVFYTVFCQRRPGRLAAALDLIVNEIPTKAGLETFVVLMPDRPLKSVEKVVQNFSNSDRVQVCTPSLPIMSPEHGQQWTRARNESMDCFDALGKTARWHANHDDDWLYSPGWDDPLVGLPTLLSQDQVWSWKAVSLFIWGQDQDGVAQVNMRQYHVSPLFGRYETGWRYDQTMTNQVPLEVEQRVKREPEREQYLPFYLLDCGTISDAERRRLYCEYANAGKLDPYTKRYIQMPKMKALPDILARYKSPKAYWDKQVALWKQERNMIDV